VRNSIEAMPSSAGADDVIEIATDVVGDAVEISVSDTGPGMPADVIESPFRSFATSKPNGLGLGLSICKSIIEAHGGRIWADDGEAPGQIRGAVFRFVLPVQLSGA
jgi:two-component system, LuxR family, sensor kinase FixL